MRGGDTLYICVAASYFVFMEVIKMNQKEFLDELNKREDGFILNQNKYYSVVTDSFDTDGGEKKLRIAQEECAELIMAISKYLRDPDCS